MKRDRYLLFSSNGFSITLLTVIFLIAVPNAEAQCTELTSGLRTPLGITRSSENHFFVSETGTSANDGRISIVDRHGNIRTFLDGLPSAINDVNEPAGPAGLVLRKHVLYVLIGVGDTIRPGPGPGTAIPNPAGPSTPIFSSLLAIFFSEHAERTHGFTLLPAQYETLANGQPVKLFDAAGRRITVKLIANFPDFAPNPLPMVPGNVAGSNPFDLVFGDFGRDVDEKRDNGDDGDRDERRNRCERDLLYVSDGGRNHVWQVDINTGGFSVLAQFPVISNPLFPGLGGPFLEAVPTGITFFRNKLFVNLFRGFPFPAGTSVVQEVDPLTGSHSPFISGLKTAIDVLAIRRDHDTDYLVLQHGSGMGPFPIPPGLLLRFDTPGSSPTTVASCLLAPTSMVVDKRMRKAFITQLGGQLVAVTLP